MFPKSRDVTIELDDERRNDGRQPHHLPLARFFTLPSHALRPSEPVQVPGRPRAHCVSGVSVSETASNPTGTSKSATIFGDSANGGPPSKSPLGKTFETSSPPGRIRDAYFDAHSFRRDGSIAHRNVLSKAKSYRVAGACAKKSSSAIFACFEVSGFSDDARYASAASRSRSPPAPGRRARASRAPRRYPRRSRAPTRGRSAASRSPAAPPGSVRTATRRTPDRVGEARRPPGRHGHRLGVDVARGRRPWRARRARGRARARARACARWMLGGGASRGGTRRRRVPAPTSPMDAVSKEVSNPKLVDKKGTPKKKASQARRPISRHTLVSPHFLYGLSRMSSASPWNGPEHGIAAAVPDANHLQRRHVTTAAGSTPVYRFRRPRGRKRRDRWYLICSSISRRDEVPIQRDPETSHAVARRTACHAHVRPARPKRAARTRAICAARETRFFCFRVLCFSCFSPRAFLLLLLLLVQLAHGVQRGLVHSRRLRPRTSCGRPSRGNPPRTVSAGASSDFGSSLRSRARRRQAGVAAPRSRMWLGVIHRGDAREAVGVISSPASMFRSPATKLARAAYRARAAARRPTRRITHCRFAFFALCRRPRSARTARPVTCATRWRWSSSEGGLRRGFALVAGDDDASSGAASVLGRRGSARRRKRPMPRSSAPPPRPCPARASHRELARSASSFALEERCSAADAADNVIAKVELGLDLDRAFERVERSRR